MFGFLVPERLDTDSFAPAIFERSGFPPTPELEAKIRDIVGFHINPLANAIALSLDEKCAIPWRAH